MSACNIYLMSYLIIRIKEIRYSYKFNSRVFVSVTAISCAVIILTGSIQYTIFVSVVLFFIMIVVYFCIFVHTARRFKCALLQRALERLIETIQVLQVHY